MGDRVEELAGKVLALLGICDGARRITSPMLV